MTQQNSRNAEGASQISLDMKAQSRQLGSFMEKLVGLVNGR
jgi:hypothetical protein